MTEIKNSKRYDLEERALNFAERVIKLGFRYWNLIFYCE